MASAISLKSFHIARYIVYAVETLIVLVKMSLHLQPPFVCIPFGAPNMHPLSLHPRSMPCLAASSLIFIRAAERIRTSTTLLLRQAPASSWATAAIACREGIEPSQQRVGAAPETISHDIYHFLLLSEQCVGQNVFSRSALSLNVVRSFAECPHPSGISRAMFIVP